MGMGFEYGNVTEGVVVFDFLVLFIIMLTSLSLCTLLLCCAGVRLFVCVCQCTIC